MLETGRLLLRRWRPRERAPCAALNADADVMAYFPKPLEPAESDALIARLEEGWAEDGIAFAVADWLALHAWKMIQVTDKKE